MDTPLPDHDFNNTWGTILGSTELQDRPIATAWMQDYWRDPVGTKRRYPEMLAQYVDKFEAFFAGALPISLHSHSTDAMCPTTVASMLMRLAMFSKLDRPESIPVSGPEDRADAAKLLGWSTAQLETPLWTVAKDSFAAAFGPLANLSAQQSWRDIATGTPSIGIQLADQTRDDLSLSLAASKKLGCIGVVVEIVNNQCNGRVTTPDELQNLSDACSENGLLLAIDETITAIRCGAPFAFQRPEYSHIRPPDLVFFGKALGACGAAIHFEAPFMQRLGIGKDNHKRKRQAIRNWQNAVTQALPLPLLIDAFGALEMAVRGDWVGRSKIIGKHIREVVSARAHSLGRNGSGQGNDILGGLDAFLFVQIDVAGSFLVMGASLAGPWVRWVRWLPRLDRHLTEKSILNSVLSSRCVEERRRLSKWLDSRGLKPQWCFWCGNFAQNQQLPWCRACCVDVCDTIECLQKLRDHDCLDKRVG